MYSELYLDNFLLNFLPSLLFLSSLIFISFSELNFFKRKINIFGTFQPMVIFFVLLLLLTLMFNFIIYFNQIYLLKFIIPFYILFFFITISFNKTPIFLIKKKVFQIKNPKILLLFFLFFLINILQVSDADSIS